MSQGLDNGSWRHQIGCSDNPVEILHDDRGWQARWHDEIVFRHRIDIEPPSLCFPYLLLDGIHDISALPGIPIFTG